VLGFQASVIGTSFPRKHARLNHSDKRNEPAVLSRDADWDKKLADEVRRAVQAEKSRPVS